MRMLPSALHQVLFSVSSCSVKLLLLLLLLYIYRRGSGILRYALETNCPLQFFTLRFDLFFALFKQLCLVDLTASGVSFPLSPQNSKPTPPGGWGWGGWEGSNGATGSNRATGSPPPPAPADH